MKSIVILRVLFFIGCAFAPLTAQEPASQGAAETHTPQIPRLAPGVFRVSAPSGRHATVPGSYRDMDLTALFMAHAPTHGSTPAKGFLLIDRLKHLLRVEPPTRRWPVPVRQYAVPWQQYGVDMLVKDYETPIKFSVITTLQMWAIRFGSSMDDAQDRAQLAALIQLPEGVWMPTDIAPPSHRHGRYPGRWHTPAFPSPPRPVNAASLGLTVGAWVHARDDFSASSAGARAPDEPWCDIDTTARFTHRSSTAEWLLDAGHHYDVNLKFLYLSRYGRTALAWGAFGRDSGSVHITLEAQNRWFAMEEERRRLGRNFDHLLGPFQNARPPESAVPAKLQP
ncbi:hypothetical protein DES53_11524 [Roseimicrobium gellanilyticum]|uniref:Secreted protein n=1 Tax=Roseimicrobium gellanilyticum TaxID=748857 RepID=A0A366H4E7_9BACT|nr:hypothetical protein [Roseimicrobium gellanilyticum]RBP36883.1 hypothetical protein DES53_11524 [Roseimicrobium gellanilyticum]